MRRQYAKRVEEAQFFTDIEAWKLFRLSAFGEAFGWTLLISGLLIKHYFTHGNNIPVDIAGQIHGTLFLIYLTAVVVLHPSLKWSPKRTLVAGLVSVPPYGTLVFEQWVAHMRRREALQLYRQLIVRGIIVDHNKLLAVQPKESAYWYLPGGIVRADETAPAALKRIIKAYTGMSPQVGQLRYVWQHTTGQTQQLEIFFIVKNSANYQNIDLVATPRGSKDLDEIGFLKPKNNGDLKPSFLRNTTAANIMRKGDVTFL